MSGQPLAFTAEVPPGGLPGTNLQWDFGDGQASPVIPAGASLTIAPAYAAPGRNSASLRIITGARVETSPVTVNVQRNMQVAGPLSETDVILGGTPGNDVFRLRSVRGGGISTVANGQPVGNLFQPRAVAAVRFKRREADIQPKALRRSMSDLLSDVHRYGSGTDSNESTAILEDAYQCGAPRHRNRPLARGQRA